MSLPFAGRVYTVTGAASGIGQAVAIRLAEKGAAGLSLSDVNIDGLAETEKECKESLPPVKMCIFMGFH